MRLKIFAMALAALAISTVMSAQSIYDIKVNNDGTFVIIRE